MARRVEAVRAPRRVKIFEDNTQQSLDRQPNKGIDFLSRKHNAPPPKDGSPPPTEPRGSLAVARESLMTYDPVNDRKSCGILEVKTVPAEPGSSGVQVKLKMDMMLEGYRPRRTVRFYPATWKVTALPREEQFIGRE